MAAAHVEHVVGHVSAGNIVGDHLHAQGAGGAGSLVDVGACDQRGGRDGIGGRLVMNGDGFSCASDSERDMEDGVGAGGDGDGLGSWAEAGSRDSERVDAEGNLGEGEFALSVGRGVESEGRVAGLKGNGGAGDGAVLGIVNDAANAWMTPLSHRQFFPQEWEALLHYNGFEVERVDGDFFGGSLVKSSDVMVWHTRRRPR